MLSPDLNIWLSKCFLSLAYADWRQWLPSSLCSPLRCTLFTDQYKTIIFDLLFNKSESIKVFRTLQRVSPKEKQWLLFFSSCLRLDRQCSSLSVYLQRWRLPPHGGKATWVSVSLPEGPSSENGKEIMASKQRRILHKSNCLTRKKKKKKKRAASKSESDCSNIAYSAYAAQTVL